MAFESHIEWADRIKAVGASVQINEKNHTFLVNGTHVFHYTNSCYQFNGESGRGINSFVNLVKKEMEMTPAITFKEEI